ncbi:MAG: DUF962 domain-containing protein [Planctomycetota bacterium]
MATPERFARFTDFYAHYLSLHSKAGTRLTHVLGTSAMLAIVGVGIAMGPWWLIPLGIGVAYLTAWLGHVFSEHNMPATFKQPVYSVLADFRMCFEIMLGQRPLSEPAPVAPADNPKAA